MTEKQSLQILGENFVAKLLLDQGHTIIARNLYKMRFEFDIISNKKGRQYVVEVRTTRYLSNDVGHYFPPMKLMTLFRGTERYFPNAQILCFLVQVSRNQKVKAMCYFISELL